MARWARVTFIGPGRAEVAAWVIGGPGLPDMAVVNLLARWQLWARRRGGRLVVGEMSDELAQLLELAGLLREMGGQAEGGEHAIGVEEGVQSRDPPA
jgi:hypothetical protein